MSGDSAINEGPDIRWRTTDKVGLLLWVGSIIGVSILWNQWAVSHYSLDETVSGGILVAFFVVVPLVFGAIAGFWIRRNGRWRELLLLAGIGAAWIALALYLQWVQDPRVCKPDSGTGCDTGFSIGATFIFAICYVPFLLGAGVGKAIAVRGTPLVAVRPSVPAVVSRAQWAPIGRQGWRCWVREFKSAPPVLKLVMVAALVWAACFYVFVGPLVFDIAYYLFGKVARIRARGLPHVGLSVAVAVTYLIALFIWSMTTPTD